MTAVHKALKDECHFKSYMDAAIDEEFSNGTEEMSPIRSKLSKTPF